MKSKLIAAMVMAVVAMVIVATPAMADYSEVLAVAERGGVFASLVRNDKEVHIFIGVNYGSPWSQEYSNSLGEASYGLIQFLGATSERLIAVVWGYRGAALYTYNTCCNESGRRVPLRWCHGIESAVEIAGERLLLTGNGSDGKRAVELIQLDTMRTVRVANFSRFSRNSYIVFGWRAHIGHWFPVIAVTERDTDRTTVFELDELRLKLRKIDAFDLPSDTWIDYLFYTEEGRQMWFSGKSILPWKPKP